MTPSTLRSFPTHLAALAACLLLFTPSLAAQNSGRGFIKAQAGTTLFSDQYDLTASGGFGVRLTDYLDLFSEAGTVNHFCDFGFFGSRITMPVQSVVTPFFEIGGGASRIPPQPVATFATKPGAASSPVSSPTHLMITATGGIHLAATRRFGFDFAVRYFRIFTDHNPLSRSQFHAGIVYRF
ncbi:MAG: hypothetical protein OXB98_11965 [Bryobacterales bacterium]|nr:hypothetical protein [Bryobacterales bacterium]